MEELVKKLIRQGVGNVSENVLLSEHSTYKVGGPARIFIEPSTPVGVQQTIETLGEAQVDWEIVGWGSNLIAADEGFPGAVIKMGELMRYVNIPDGAREEGQQIRVTVGAGTMTNHLVRDLHKAGLSGAEFVALVPGTFGGAVAMNAGTKHGEMSDILVEVTLVDKMGKIQVVPAEALSLSYRQSHIPDDSIVVEGVIIACCGSVEQGKFFVRAERDYRNETQPYSKPNAGSVFRNPLGDHAGRLIEEAGLKGTRVGGAHISELHANFVVTEEGATASDVVTLMAHIRRTVEAFCGVKLEAEQRLLGFGTESVGELLDRWPVPEGVLQ